MLVYIVAVLTRTGQEFEDAALRGAASATERATATATRGLGTISVTTLALGLAIIGIAGWVRGGLRLAGAATGIVVVGLGAAEVLKRYVLQRPDLLGDGSIHNSFPSGHTTIAMTVLLAVLVVVPWRWRGLAMLVVMTWTVGIAGYTITARWHRLSDTVGANLLSLMVAALAALALARWDRVRTVDEPARSPRVVYAGIVAALGAVAFVAGVILAIAYATRRNDAGFTPDEIDDLAYAAALTLSTAGSMFTGLTAWYTWHRLTT